MSRPSFLKDLSAADIRQVQGEIENMKEEYDDKAVNRGKALNGASNDYDRSTTSSNRFVSRRSLLKATPSRRDMMMSARSMDMRSRGDDRSLAIRAALATAVPLRPTSRAEEDNNDRDADDSD